MASMFGAVEGILRQYSTGNATPDQAPQHFQQVAQQVPQSTLSSLLGRVFQSQETGSFGQNISQMYQQSNPQQQAGILSRLASVVGPGALSRFGINLPGAPSGNVTPEQAQQVSPENVEQLANHAQQQNPNVVHEAGEFYSQHPQLVKALGTGAAMWALRNFHI
jgi:hypothetical protein